MNSRETNFRRHPNNPSLLRNYILYLFEEQHFLEARYYHAKLMVLDSSDIATNTIGYKLALAVASHDIKEYERNLITAGASSEQLYSLHLHYCLTFNDKQQMMSYLYGLLELVPIMQYTVEGVWAAIQKIDDADFIYRFAKNYLPRINENPEVDKVLKKKLYQMLLSTLENRP